MRRAAIMLSLFFLVFLTGGCSDSNDSAPNSNQPHILGAQWQLPSEHASSAIDNSPPCFGCHEMSGGQSNAPDCRQCHTAGPPNFVLGTCDSCHDAPPDGDTFPNRAGAHAPHNDLNNVTGVCNTCHNGAGTGTLHHYATSSPSVVAFLSDYNAKTGPASFTPDASNPGTGTCSNVSCHGGVTTPAWLTGQLDVNTQCKSCHILGTAPQTPQYNSPYSGRHRFHVETLPFPCTNCHDPVKLEEGGHFAGLNTPQFEGDPAATIKDDVGFNDVEPVPTCTTSNSNGICHDGETRSW
jgi:predicted CxxxxCH...CXXCH cytochrome family protein